MSIRQNFQYNAQLLLALGMLVVACVYWSGLSGGWLFDDYPNIVDNHSVQPVNASLPSLVGAALSSPASEFKRPLASLSFAANYLTAGMNPYWWKLSNLLIHLLNGLLVFLLARSLINASSSSEKNTRDGVVAALIAVAWMMLPINLTGVLYVVQRMESMANLFVLTGLLGYIAGRNRMLAAPAPMERIGRFSPEARGLIMCLASITVPTAFGLLAKETAVMLPLYALLIEWTLFHFRRSGIEAVTPVMDKAGGSQTDLRIVALFMLVLALPMVLGLAWLLPGLLKPESWATRDFTLGTRLLSEARIVVGYIAWTLLPTPDALSFYHDDFHVSTGLFAPWSTLVSILILAMLMALTIRLRFRQPLVSLGIALFLGCHLLTGTVLPLELIYEHRNYFASFGLMLAVVPLLAAPRDQAFALPRHLLLAGLLICWAFLTALTAYAWGDPLRLAEDLASRAPESPRAQYELGRTYIIYSHYDPASPFTQLAYAPLEKAAALPDASILAEQAMIFMNARMNLPIKDAWWDSLIAKLLSRKATVQDESSLAALTQCARENNCRLPQTRMMQAFAAALIHSASSARLHANYSDYCWNVVGNKVLGLREIEAAITAAPTEPAYRITQIRMLAVLSRRDEARAALTRLDALNYGGRLDGDIAQLRALPILQ